MGVVDGSLGGTILSRNIVGVRVLAGSGLLSLVGSSLRLSGLVLGAGSIGIGLALGFTLSLALGRRRAGIFLLGSVGGFGLCGACRIAQAGGRSRRGFFLPLHPVTEIATVAAMATASTFFIIDFLRMILLLLFTVWGESPHQRNDVKSGGLLIFRFPCRSICIIPHFSLKVY